MLELYPHNQQAYDNAKFVFKTENKTAIVHPTGTGKSLIIAKFIIENPNAKILFISPNVFIHKEIKKHVKGFSKNVEFQTYQFFLFNPTTSYISFDFIFLDEFHRVGADEWNKKIQEIIALNPNAKILGTTATHIRYLDDERNMVDELFDGNISSYLSLGEAIEKGIHKKPIYVSALYNIREIIDDTEKRLKKNNKKKELENLKSRKVVWEESNGIDFIINKHLNQDRKKIIVFCKSVEHFQYIEALIVPVLIKFYSGNVEFNRVHSYNGITNVKIFNHFETSKIPQVLFSVDMLNEGIHVTGVDTVMMFRDTASPIVYFQQMGRAFTVGQTKQPLIFDFVNNFNIKNSVGSIVQNFYNDFKLINENNYLKKRNVIIDFYDETLDFQNFINEFSAFKTWEENYNKLVLYVHTNKKFPKATEMKWISNQRIAYRNGKLTQKQIDLWNDIAPNYLQATFPTWEESYNELISFIHDNKRFPKQSEMKWVNDQKTRFRKNELTEKQINLLLKIDNNFFVNKKDWNSFYQKLIDLYEKKGTIPTHKELPWINSQKRLFNNGKLEQNKIDLLLNVDKNFFVMKTIRKSWLSSFEEFKNFYNKYKRLPKNSEMPWFANQKTAFNTSKLTQEQIDLLLQIDKTIFDKDKGWKLKYTSFKKFYLLNKRLPNIKEMPWVQTQRNAYIAGKLTQQQIDLLMQVDKNIFINKRQISNTTYFEQKVKELKQYILDNGKMPTLRQMSFIYASKQKYKKGQLTQEQINSLLKIDSNFFS